MRTKISSVMPATGSAADADARSQDILRATRVGLAIERLSSGLMVDVNDAFARDLGYAREELVGQSSLALGLWAEPAQRAAWVAQLDDPQPEGCELSLRRRDGQTVEFLAHAHRSHIDGEDCLVGLLTNITARKHAERRLTERAALLADSQSIAKMGSWQVALDPAGGRDVWVVSHGLREIYGYAPERNITGQDGFDIMHPDDRSNVASVWLAALRQGGPTTWVHRIVVQGAVKWLRVTAQFAFDPETGEAVSGRGTCQDITREKVAENALAASEQLFRAITDTSPLAVYMSTGPEQRAGYVNPTFVRLFGYTLAEVPTVADWWPQAYPDDAYRSWVSQEWGRRVKSALEHHTNIEPMRVSVTCKDGSVKRIEWGFVNSGAQNWAFGLDVTASEEAQASLQLAASVFSHAREGIMITDANGAIVDVNDTFTRITGYSRADVLGQNPRILSSGRQSPEFYLSMWQSLLTEGFWSGEVWNRRKNGEVFAELQTVSAVRNERGQILQFVALFSDITTLKQQQQQLENIAHFDALTHLPNRVLLADRLHQAMAHAQRNRQPMAVVYLDLDGFKSVNDLHGHNAGDLLLVTIASRMQQCLREGDTLARLGGDEFVAVFGDMHPIEATAPVFTRLLEAAATPVAYLGHMLQVSASIGVASFPQRLAVDADQLLRQADQAMYQAKLAGKNRIQVFAAQ